MLLAGVRDDQSCGAAFESLRILGVTKIMRSFRFSVLLEKLKRLPIKGRLDNSGMPEWLLVTVVTVSPPMTAVSPSATRSWFLVSCFAMMKLGTAHATALALPAINGFVADLGVFFVAVGGLVLVWGVGGAALGGCARDPRGSWLRGGGGVGAFQNQALSPAGTFVRQTSSSPNR